MQASYVVLQDVHVGDVAGEHRHAGEVARLTAHHVVGGRRAVTLARERTMARGGGGKRRQDGDQQGDGGQQETWRRGLRHVDRPPAPETAGLRVSGRDASAQKVE